LPLNVSRPALADPRATVGAWIPIGVCGLVAVWRLPVATFPDISTASGGGSRGPPLATPPDRPLA
jgi:hypothetical protein